MEAEIDALPIVQEATQTGAGAKRVSQVSIIDVHLIVIDNDLNSFLKSFCRMTMLLQPRKAGTSLALAEKSLPPLGT